VKLGATRTTAEPGMCDGLMRSKSGGCMIIAGWSRHEYSTVRFVAVVDITVLARSEHPGVRYNDRSIEGNACLASHDTSTKKTRSDVSTTSSMIKTMKRALNHFLVKRLLRPVVDRARTMLETTETKRIR
jgi:hypothetical protein